MEYIIDPLKGLNNVKFKMKQEDVSKILGDADSVIDDDVMEEIREKRGGVTYIYQSKKLVDIFFDGDFFKQPDVHLFVDQIDICNETNLQEVLAKLPGAKPSAEIKGYINFYGLGISLGGFGKKKLKEGKLLKIFPRERIASYERFLNL